MNTNRIFSIFFQANGLHRQRPAAAIRAAQCSVWENRCRAPRSSARRRTR
jgi:hypothetical protein